MFNVADEIIFFSETMEQHKQHLKEVLNRLRNNNITIDPDHTKAFRDYSVTLATTKTLVIF